MDSTEIEVLENYIAEHKLKITKQRRAILNAFLGCENHVSVEELYAIVSGQEPKIGLATIYRTLALLTKSGLALEIDFGDGFRKIPSPDFATGFRYALPPFFSKRYSR